MDASKTAELSWEWPAEQRLEAIEDLCGSVMELLRIWPMSCEAHRIAFDKLSTAHLLSFKDAEWLELNRDLIIRDLNA